MTDKHLPGWSVDDMRRVAQARLERLPHGDMGNGYYRNPVLVGGGGDNSVVRVGVDGDLSIAYEGWQYPADWVVECHCLEAPKLVYRQGYYYMSSAQGGTSGPATAHMGVIARSRSVQGPWENSPLNPIVRTYKRDQRWWR